jgi:hypothetical protein
MVINENTTKYCINVEWLPNKIELSTVNILMTYFPFFVYIYNIVMKKIVISIIYSTFVLLLKYYHMSTYYKDIKIG